MKKINLIVLIVVSIFLFTLSSCKNDEEDYMIATFAYSCSPDLLEFVIPTVHYVDNNGVQKDVSLKKEDLKAKSNGMINMNLTINGETATVTKEFIDNIWEFKKQYNGWKAKDKIWVTYELKDGITVDRDKKYSFFHGMFNYTWNVYSDGSLVHVYNKSAVPTETIVQGDADVRDYLSIVELEKVTLSVDLTATSQIPEK